MQIDLKENEKLGNPMGVEVFFLKSCIFITFVFSFGKIQRKNMIYLKNLQLQMIAIEVFTMRKTSKNTNMNHH